MYSLIKDYNSTPLDQAMSNMMIQHKNWKAATQMHADSVDKFNNAFANAKNNINGDGDDHNGGVLEEEPAWIVTLNREVEK